jgi:CelD/BcsL family acetyltransferase involved in cellulose biosynthesis
VTTDFAQLAPMKEDWQALAERSRNVFATWEWAETWWKHFGREEELRTRLIPSVAVLPLYVDTNGPLRILRFIGTPHADEVGPVCAPEDRAAAAAALRDALGEGGFHLFLGDSVPPGWAKPLGARIVERTSSPIVSLTEGSWDEYLAKRSSNFRQQVRTAERRLARDRSLEFRLTDQDRLRQDLDLLFALHRARWPGSHWFAEAEAFHREFAAIALERGWLRLWVLELDGHGAAGWLGYRFAGVESYYQAGRDPALRRERVGFVLLAHTIREALQDGMDEYRLLRGDESFKYRFATSDPGLETIARPNGALGRVALALRTARRRLSRDA